MLKKKIKFILKISAWTYLIVTFCPQVVELVKTIAIESLKFCGYSVTEHIEQSITQTIQDSIIVTSIGEFINKITGLFG